MQHESRGFDFDWMIVGSGFCGSVSALRLAEKGFKVGVLEQGKRYRDEEYTESTWQLRRWLWAPFLGLRGIFRMTPFKDVFVVSGTAVGGGSTATPTRSIAPIPHSSRSRSWDLNDWAGALSPDYDSAEGMLAVGSASTQDQPGSHSNSPGISPSPSGISPQLLARLSSFVVRCSHEIQWLTYCS